MKSPPFFHVLSQAVDEPGRIKAALFASFFAFVLLMIAAIFGSLIIKGFPPQSAWSAFSSLVAGLLTFGLTAAGLLSTLVTLTLAFGTKTSHTGHSNTAIITRLWGAELVRAEYGPLRSASAIVPAHVSVTTSFTTPWSHIAAANRKTQHTVGGIGILETAFWSLHAQRLIEIGIQHESIVYFNKWRVSNTNVVNARLPVDSPLDEQNRLMPHGFWEKKLFDSLVKYGADTGLELFDLILVTYGDSSAQPLDRVIEIAERDLANGRTETDALKSEAKSSEAWDVIRRSISQFSMNEPELELLVQERIRLALKNRVDT